MSIAKVGNYTRAQIKNMQRVVTLREMFEEAFSMWNWLEKDVVGAVLSEYQPSVRSAMDRIRSMYPAAHITGLESDCPVSLLYLLKPLARFDGKLILAMCHRIQERHPFVRTAGIQEGSPRTRGVSTQGLGDAILHALWTPGAKQEYHVCSSR